MGTRPQQAGQRSRADADQAWVADTAAELAALWRVLAAATAHDSAGQFRSDRQVKGARDGSAATVNIDVVDATVLVASGTSKLAAEVVRILNLEQQYRPAGEVIAALPDWHRALEQRGLPATAEYLRRDLGSWWRMVRQAIGATRHDERAGVLCPDHRDEHPTELRVEGARAEIAASLVAGPPDRLRLLAGPACRACLDRPGDEGDNPRNQIPANVTSRRARRRRRRAHREHETCRAVIDRRLVDDAGRVTDWLLTPAGGLAWSSLVGEHAFAWSHSGALICRHCRRAWSTVEQRRLLARELQARGDKLTRELAAVVR